MSDARERIAGVLFDIARVIGYEYMSREDAEDFEHEVNDIITIVRDTMLTDAAIDAFQDAEAGFEHDQFSGSYQAYQAGMKAALDTALGTENEGAENASI